MEYEIVGFGESPYGKDAFEKDGVSDFFIGKKVSVDNFCIERENGTVACDAILLDEIPEIGIKEPGSKTTFHAVVLKQLAH